MAFDVSGLPNYVNQEANRDELLRAALFGSKSKTLAKTYTGIKGSQTINIASEAAVYQADGCEITASGNSALTQRTITVGAIVDKHKYCTKDLLPKWTQHVLRQGSEAELDENSILQYFAEYGVATVAKQEEINVWQGDTTGAGNLALYDGWLKIIDAGSPVNGNPTSITAATGITSGNIIGILQGMYALMPADILDRDDLFIAMGTDVFRTFMTALYNGNNFHFAPDDNSFEYTLPGTQITVYGLNGLNGTNRIIASYWENMIVGTDLENEEEDYKWIYDEVDEVWYRTIRFKSGTQVGFTEEIVEFTLVP